jgi:hypothetical protein
MKRWITSTALVAAVSLSPIVLGADASPTAAASPAVGNGVFQRAPGRVRIRANTPQSGSSNWSGYVQVASAPHTFTAVTDTFTVPTVDSSSVGTQFAADWVGIGGYTYYGSTTNVDGTLVQTGIQTQVRTTKRGTHVVYDAWTEILPQAERPLALTLSPGDTVTATVEETARNRWLMEVDDVTTGATQGRVVSYRSKGLSAEAIHERPCLRAPCSNPSHYAVLAQTSDVTFDPGYVSIAPVGSPPADQALLGTLSGLPANDDVQLNEVVMQENEFADLATPSVVNATGDGFTVADGSVPPPAPTG